MITRPELTEKRIEEILNIISSNPHLSRSQLSIRICELWDWRSPNGMTKDMSCRDMLRSLDRKGIIRLPLPRSAPCRAGIRHNVLHLEHDMTPIESELKDLLPLDIHLPDNQDELIMFKSCLDQFHYLGFDRTIGENMKYVVYSNKGALIACLLFGSAAWSCRDRDGHIGWDMSRRREALFFLTNNTRFWIPHWVRVPNLASHVLSRVTRRLSVDWKARYGHPLLAVETFVDTSRFHGYCYQAANWIHVGRTSGRGRDGGHHHAILPEKDIYLYPLDKHYREKLKGGQHGQDKL